MKAWYQSRRIQLLAELTVVFLALFGVLRVVFFVWFSSSAEPASMTELIRAFYVGAKFDLRLALIVILPLIGLGLIPKYGLGHRSVSSTLSRVYLVFASIVLLSIYFFDFFYYDYLQQRIDASALRFIDTRDNAQISAQMIWQSYPVLWAVFALLLSAAAMVFLIRLIFRHTVEKPWRPVNVTQRIIGGVIVFVCVMAGLYGQWSWFPLRWSNAMFSENKLVSSIALNPALFFASTFKNRERHFDIDRTREHYPFIAKYLDVDNHDSVKLNYDRMHRPVGLAPSKKPNIVIVLLETLSTHWMGIQGNLLKPTPNMDYLIERSVYFKKNYVPRFGTARSTWALVTGIPDVLPTKTATRNPLIVKQHSIFNAFDGYEKYYFIGGNANWANIRGVLQQSIPGLRIYEEGSYEQPRVDAWGVSDLTVFEKAHNVLSGRESKQPFVAYIQTAGNHSPYTIPDDNRGFEEKQVSYDRVVSAAFASNAEYNGVRLLDHFVGEYFKLAQSSTYADDTIFVFFGDHGLPRSKDLNMEMDQSLGIVELRSPMWIYAPALGLQPKVIDTTTTLLDLMPTVAHLAGVPYRNTTLGQNLLDDALDADRSVFLMHKGVRGVDRIGYLGRQYYLGFDLDGQSVALHETSARKGAAPNIAQDHTQLTAKLKQQALSFYETAQYMLFHNPPRSHHME